MKTYKRKSVQVVKSITCDRCKKEALYEDMEFQEFTSIEYRGGYNSVFGDGCEIKLDLCQHCVKETLGQWLKIEESVYLPEDSSLIALKGGPGS